MSIDAEFLLARLPAFYRDRDAETGGQLRALLEVIAEQGAFVEADIARLYDNWFIETCDDWLIPYIGELLGVRALYPVSGTQAFTLRAYVANTLRLRRRKGTLPVLEQLACDTTGWCARAVEFFELLGTTQYLDHRRLHNVRTPNVRDAAQMERVDGPFDRCAHSVEVRPLTAGRYNIANIGLYIWRLQAYPLQRCTAHTATSLPGFYSFDALGRSFPGPLQQGEGMLFNRSRSEQEITHLALPENVPEPLSRRVLHDELTALRQALADGVEPDSVYFPNDQEQENGPVLRVWLDDLQIPPEHLVVCNLSALPGVVPEQWRRPPPSVTVKTTSVGGAAKTFPADASQFLVGIDPVLGRIALPAGKTATTVEVAYSYGFPGDIGGGPYDRRPAQHDREAEQGLLKPTDFQVLLRVPDDHPSLADALTAVKAGTSTLIYLLDDATQQLTPDLDLPDTHLAIEAANKRRPVLVGDWRLRGNLNTRLSLSGLLLDGQLGLDGALGEVNVRHCSLTPDKGGIRHTGAASQLWLRLTHCLCGPLQVAKAIAGVVGRACVFDNADKPAFDLPDTYLDLDRCSVFGTTAAGGLTASNCLFNAKLTITRLQEGCVRFSFVPQGSQTPRRYRCLPDLVMQGVPATKAKRESVRVTPAFTSVTFGHPAYSQLRLGCAVELCRGAEDGAEMGVWNLLQQPQREANLRQALDEYLRLGLEAGVIFVN
ncbi:hypothetical protein OH720_15690 [Pseudomonas sp. WJP1]|uniref:hypothetical protein n=1 Tax=Pseudomonas sp. WJP1 TaxID=2986947 RepID=UPI002349AAE3|nr:hypothetical protein [Pseudomonas sp. WJP1]WCM54387.1 hypothetical protein OH720_15690 [Pseudomonas sp. WJP1]